MKPDEAKELEAPTDVAGQVERVVRRRLHPHDNKFHQGNGDDQKHYWLMAYAPGSDAEATDGICF